MKFKNVILGILPILLMYVIAVLYGFCLLPTMSLLRLQSFDPIGFDANDMTRTFLPLSTIIPILLSVCCSVRLFDSRWKRAIYISATSSVVFLIAGKFVVGLLFK